MKDPLNAIRKSDDLIDLYTCFVNKLVDILKF